MIYVDVMVVHDPLEFIDEEDKFPGLQNDLPALLSRDQRNGGRQSYLWYPVQLTTQSNNNTMRSKLIYSTMFTQVCVTHQISTPRYLALSVASVIKVSYAPC
jgi:hypothetical protein